jgi:HEAT repeat protein
MLFSDFTSYIPTGLLQRESVAYALSFLFLLNPPASRKIVKALINLAADNSEAPAVRAQALEGLGNQLYKDLSSSLYRLGVAAILEALNSSEAEVRFWGCYAAGEMKAKAVLPQGLRILKSRKKEVG